MVKSPKQERQLLTGKNIRWLWKCLQAQGSEESPIWENTMNHGKDTYFKQIETTQL